jgi:hypothetical protein
LKKLIESTRSILWTIIGSYLAIKTTKKSVINMCEIDGIEIIGSINGIMKNMKATMTG